MTTPPAQAALSSPLPGELLHFQLQTVNLVSKVLLEEPVVQLSRLATSLSLAQSGCEPHELVIKNKSHSGGKTTTQKQPKVEKMEREREWEGKGGKKLWGTQGKKAWGKKKGIKQSQKQDEGEPGRGKVDFPFFFFYSSTTVYSN